MTIKRHTRSLLEEIDTIFLTEDKDSIIESRANHIIKSAINLIESIRENYDSSTADDLERRFLLAIKNHDWDKFQRGIKRLHTAKTLRVVDGEYKE